MRALVLLLSWACAGCRFAPEAVGDDGVMQVDGSDFRFDGAVVPDATDGSGGIDTVLACEPWPVANVDVCAATTPPPAGDLILESGTSYRFATDTGVWSPALPADAASATLGQTSGMGPNVRVLALRDLVIPVGAELVAEGPIPLVILVHGSASIGGNLTAGSDRNADACTTATTGGSSGGKDGGGGGGGGGGYGGTGGTGGSGDSNNGDSGGSGGAGAAIRGNPEIVPLRGGCRGAPGGRIGSSGSGGSSGGSGGALQISVRETLDLSGQINASGQGGSGGSGSISGAGGRGGGGGGSGGAVTLEGNVVTVSGRVCANGGAGGEGQSGAGAGGNGQPGQCDAVAATSPDEHDDGGDGGDGGYLGDAGGNPGSSGSSGGGGGGGGGGVGRIRIWQRIGGTPAVSGTVSPQPQFLAP